MEIQFYTIILIVFKESSVIISKLLGRKYRSCENLEGQLIFQINIFVWKSRNIDDGLGQTCSDFLYFVSRLTGYVYQV